MNSPLISRLAAVTCSAASAAAALAGVRGIIIAMAAAAPIVVADEPTAELDADTAAVVFASLRAEAEAGATVVLATHDPDLAALCDATIHLVDGRIVLD